MALTTVILTNKSKKEIANTLASVSSSDQVTIIEDSPSGHPLNSDFAAQRNYGLSKSVNDWVMFVDDDEVVSSALMGEIQSAIESNDFNGYLIPRLDRFYGQTLYHGETGKIRLLRLGRKSKGKWQRPVHEIWKIKDPVGQLNQPLIHNRPNLVSAFIDRIILYGPLDASALLKEGKPFSYWRLIINPTMKFMLNYFFKLGFLDRTLGLFHAYLMSVQSLSVRIFQWQAKS